MMKPHRTSACARLSFPPQGEGLGMRVLRLDEGAPLRGTEVRVRALPIVAEILEA